MGYEMKYNMMSNDSDENNDKNLKRKIEEMEIDVD